MILLDVSTVKTRNSSVPMECPCYFTNYFLSCTISQSARCRTVVRATSLVNGTPRFLDPRGSKTPEPIDIKFDRGDYVGDITPHANFGISTPKGAVLHMRENVIIRVYFLHPVTF